MMKALISLIFLLYSVTLFSQERITLLFVGDLMQHRAQIDAARTSDGKYDYSPCFSLIKEEISRADIAIGNLEVLSVENLIKAILLSVHPTNICKLSKMPDSTFFSQQTIIAWIEARPDWNGPSHKSNHFPYPMQVLTGTL